jgi:hypothetical protein
MDSFIQMMIHCAIIVIAALVNPQYGDFSKALEKTIILAPGFFV